uniref:Uncharacterized protein n=1 Tax=Arundo donax TaxID=35708 RepID=A0A0A9H8T0_ARUDO
MSSADKKKHNISPQTRYKFRKKDRWRNCFVLLSFVSLLDREIT